MDVVVGGHGGLWGWHLRLRKAKRLDAKDRRRRIESSSSDVAEVSGGSGYRFPLKQALTAGSLALAGDTIAQVRGRWSEGNASKQRSPSDSEHSSEDALWAVLSDHDWFRGLRMTSYGFLFYGPGSYLWYQFLDSFLPRNTVENLLLKVALNQIILCPCVIAVVFAWNNILQGKVSQLPDKYQKDALPTLLYGFRFWIPISLLNFWVVPLQARVAFMSLGSIFWNFCLSSTMSK